MKVPKEYKPRFDKLLEVYLERNRSVPDVVDIFMLEVLTMLKKVYDDNFEQLRSLPKKDERRKPLVKREKMLNNISIDIRRGLSVYLNDPNPYATGSPVTRPYIYRKELRLRHDAKNAAYLTGNRV